MGWIEGRGFIVFIEGEHEVEIPGGRVGGEFSIGRVPDEEKEVEDELGEGGTARFEKGLGYARRPSVFVGGAPCLPSTLPTTLSIPQTAPMQDIPTSTPPFPTSSTQIYPMTLPYTYLGHFPPPNSKLPKCGTHTDSHLVIHNLAIQITPGMRHMPLQ